MPTVPSREYLPTGHSTAAAAFDPAAQNRPGDGVEHAPEQFAVVRPVAAPVHTHAAANTHSHHALSPRPAL